VLAQERLQRLMAWCRFPIRPEAWDHATAERCRQLLPQIATAALAVSDLPPMFRVPLSRYLGSDPRVDEIIGDDDRLLLMLSDLRDYLNLMKRGYL
jgi:hypothetical protein